MYGQSFIIDIISLFCVIQLHIFQDSLHCIIIVALEKCLESKSLFGQGYFMGVYLFGLCCSIAHLIFLDIICANKDLRE